MSSNLDPRPKSRILQDALAQGFSTFFQLRAPKIFRMEVQTPIVCGSPGAHGSQVENHCFSQTRVIWLNTRVTGCNSLACDTHEIRQDVLMVPSGFNSMNLYPGSTEVDGKTPTGFRRARTSAHGCPFQRW